MAPLVTFHIPRRGVTARASRRRGRRASVIDARARGRDGQIDAREKNAFGEKTRW